MPAERVKQSRSGNLAGWWHTPGNQLSRPPGQLMIHTPGSHLLPDWACIQGGWSHGLAHGRLDVQGLVILPVPL